MWLNKLKQNSEVAEQAKNGISDKPPTAQETSSEVKPGVCTHCAHMHEFTSLLQERQATLTIVHVSTTLVNLGCGQIQANKCINATLAHITTYIS